MRKHSNEPIILWIDKQVIKDIPDEFCADTVVSLACVQIFTAHHRLRNYVKRGLIEHTASNKMGLKFYKFAPGVTELQRLNLFAMSHPDQVRQILSMLPDRFETRHVWPKLHCRDDEGAATQCIVRMLRLGLVDRVGTVRSNTGLYRKLPQQPQQ